MSKHEEELIKHERKQKQLLGVSEYDYWPAVYELPLYACPVCSAVVNDRELHADWHMRDQR